MVKSNASNNKHHPKNDITGTGIEIHDQNVDLSQIFPVNAIKAMLRNEDVLGADGGGRVYTGAATLLAASSALFIHDLASAAIEVAKQQQSNDEDGSTIIIQKDHIQECVFQQKRKFSFLSDIGSRMNDESQKKALRSTYSGILTRKNYKQQQQKTKIQPKKQTKINQDNDHDTLLQRQPSTDEAFKYYAKELQNDNPSSPIIQHDNTIVEDEDDYD